VLGHNIRFFIRNSKILPREKESNQYFRSSICYRAFTVLRQKKRRFLVSFYRTASSFAKISFFLFCWNL